MKTMLLAYAVVASLAGVGSWYGSRAQNEVQIQIGNATAQGYLTAPVEEGEIRRVVTATGALNATTNVEVGSQLSGQIAEVYVDFNDNVKRGQPLAQLDQRTFEARVEQARASVSLAEAVVASAKAELQRTQKLGDRKIAFVVQVEDAGTKLASAEAELNQKKAQLKLAEIDLDRTVIRSPINGVVVGRKVNEGQTLATDLEAKTLFIVAGDLRQMQIEANIDEADISMLRVGQRATFTVDAYPGRQFTAIVHQIRKAPEVLQNVVTYTVVLSTTNDNNLLLPGMTALVHIAVEQTGPVLKVPLAALRFSPNRGQHGRVRQSVFPHNKSAVLWVVGDEGEPKSLKVELGEADESDVAVVGGALAKGDSVIVGEKAKSVPKRLFGIRMGL